MKRLFFAFFFLIIAMGICYIAPNYQVTTFYGEDEIRIVIDDKEITKEISSPVIMIDDKIMLSSNTIDKYFDKWLYHDKKYDTYITTSSTHIAKIKVDSDIIKIDGVEKKIDVPAQFVNGVLYFPIEELINVYDIEIENNSKIIITTSKPEMSTIIAENEITLRGLKKRFSREIDTIEIGEELNVFRYSKDKEWVWARSNDGNLGYVSQDDLIQYNIAEYVEEKKAIEKVNLVWEGAENGTPNRQGQKKIENIDVISPTWIYLKDTDGNLKTTIDKKYVVWAHDEGYKLWPVLKNDNMGIEETSQVVTDMKARENLIEQLLDICEEYKLDGINIDFEEMKKEDAEAFSQFVREISVALRSKELTVSVDVTVPDGSDTWSLCYNRNELIEAVDYMILMAYDQYGKWSKTPGSVASFQWVESNLKKMVETYELDSEKIILAIPLYSRVWKVVDGKVEDTWAPIMKGLNDYLTSPNTSWVEEDKQYYYESKKGNEWTVMWMDEKESIIQKLSLIKKYDLAGSAYWLWGYENETFWDDINEYIKY